MFCLLEVRKVNNVLEFVQVYSSKDEAIVRKKREELVNQFLSDQKSDDVHREGKTDNVRISVGGVTVYYIITTIDDLDA